MTQPATDRNLLFGVLALQSDLIDRTQFAEACAAWASRKDSALSDVLVERGWLTAADKCDVERLLERKLKKHGNDAQASLAAATPTDARALLAQIDDAAVQDTLSRLPESDSPPLPATTMASAKTSS
jgi:eukaryotic-like serine/threonine-protein kinase